MDAEKNIIEALTKLIKETEPLVKDTLPIESVKQLIDQELKGFKLGKMNLNKDLLDLIEERKEVVIKMPTMQIVKSPKLDKIPYVIKIIDDLMMGNNVYLFGEAGTGKTELAESVTAMMNLSYIKVTCNQWTSPLDLIGGQTITGYKEGALIEAWRDGKVLILDEIPKLDSNTAGILNDALAKTDKPAGTVIFNGANQPIKKHKDFHCIATGNTTGKAVSMRYNGNNKQDLSLLDRFSGSYYQVEFNTALEKSLLYSKVYEICTAIRAEIIKTNADEIMTLRTMLNVNRIYHLEMERELELVPRVLGGKTLIDCLDSYFSIMNKDKALLIKTNVNFELFKNTYKDKAAFRTELGEVYRYAA